MHTKTEILEKLNTLEAAADPGLSFAGIISAVNQLSGSSVSAAMEKAIVGEVHLLVRVGIIYVDGSHRSISGQPPTGYDDFSALFNAETGDEIMEITVEEFNDATYTETKIDPVTGEEITITKNTYLDSWTASYSATAGSVVANLTTLAGWCNGQGMGNSIQTMLQPKEIKSVPDRVEMSQTIYLERKAKDVINAYELSVMIPEVVS